MQVTITDPDTGKRYRIRPLNGLCYALDCTPSKKNNKGEDAKSEFTFTGKYPSSINHGIELALGLMLADPDGKGSIDIDTKHAVRELKKHYQKMTDSVIASVTIQAAVVAEKGEEDEDPD